MPRVKLIHPHQTRSVEVYLGIDASTEMVTDRV
jgi:hypothetical protein